MSQVMEGALGVAEAWLAAVCAADGARVEALSHPEIDVVGPRGRGRMPRSVLHDWLARSGFSARPLRWFCGGEGQVVLELDARWHDTATGAPQDRLRIGAYLRVADGRVAAFERFDEGLGAALAAVGLTDRDEVSR